LTGLPFGQAPDYTKAAVMSAYGVPPQPVDATHALNIGVRNETKKLLQSDVSFLKKTEGSIARGKISPTCWMIGRRFGHPCK
jgi:hypothetical protein